MILKFLAIHIILVIIQPTWAQRLMMRLSVNTNCPAFDVTLKEILTPLALHHPHWGQSP